MKKSTILLTAALMLLISCSKKEKIETGYIPVSNGGQIYYESQGEGTPVILLHGHTLDMRMWDPQMKALLDAGFRVIRPEMRGYGHSSKQQVGVQFTHLDDMMTVMDSLHIDKAHVVGLSMGSFVASEMVAMYPDRLITATLASGNIRNMPGPSTLFDNLELARKDSVIAQNLALGIEKWKEEWIEKLVSGGGSNREAIRESVSQQVHDWDGWQLVNREMRNYYGYEAWDTLKSRCPELPVLILSGEKEGKGKNPMLEYLPNSKQVIIPDCGHMSNMEKPEEFTQLMLENIERAK
ncbi:MAG: alpha/beta hydrolase [Bacteroidales bacterium]|nr:alpha/beta hydrolase [Bacteroidales bacterium]